MNIKFFYSNVKKYSDAYLFNIRIFKAGSPEELLFSIESHYEENVGISNSCFVVKIGSVQILICDEPTQDFYIIVVIHRITMNNHPVMIQEELKNHLFPTNILATQKWDMMIIM